MQVGLFFEVVIVPVSIHFQAIQSNACVLANFVISDVHLVFVSVSATSKFQPCDLPYWHGWNFLEIVNPTGDFVHITAMVL